MKNKIEKRKIVINFVIFIAMILLLSVLQSKSIISLPLNTDDINITRSNDIKSQLYNPALDVAGMVNLPTRIGFGDRGGSKLSTKVKQIKDEKPES